MKKIVGLAIVVAVVAGGAAVYAGGACCAAKKEVAAEAKAQKQYGCAGTFSKLNLTDEQKARVAALREECDKVGCTVASREKFMKGMKEILTAEQIEQCRAECEKEGKGPCPYMAAEEKTDTKG